jgi:hypothetical protein
MHYNCIRSQLTGHQTMEKEFLQGMDWNLSVKFSEYQHWRSLLDGFIFARQREAQSLSIGRYPPSYSPPSLLHTPAQAYTTTMMDDSVYSARRGRSFSPPALSPSALQPCHSPSVLQRKRSAYDAFAIDVPPTWSQYDPYHAPSSRPTRRVAGQDGRRTRSRKQLQPSTSGSMARSSSLNRHISKLPNNVPLGRRGSSGHILHSLQGLESNMRHTAYDQASHMPIQGWIGDPDNTDWATTGALVAPYEGGGLPNNVPPEVSLRCVTCSQSKLTLCSISCFTA